MNPYQSPAECEDERRAWSWPHPVNLGWIFVVIMTAFLGAFIRQGIHNVSLGYFDIATCSFGMAIVCAFFAAGTSALIVREWNEKPN